MTGLLERGSSPLDADDAPISVSEAGDIDARAWDQFLSTHPASSFYQLFGWRGVVSKSLGLQPIYLLARSNDRIVGVLPLVFLESRLFGRILCSLPFLNYGGPCASSSRAVQLLIDEAMRRASELRADYLELRCAEPLPTELPVSTRKVSMTINLDPDPDVVWNAFTSKHRKNVRRAYRAGLTVQSGGMEFLDDFYSVLERSWRDLGTPLYQQGYFASILAAFPEQTRIYLCRQDSRVICVALTGTHANLVEGLWAGGLPSARELQANYVLYWEMIRDVCLRGCRSFHLGRSTADSGSEQFKSRWNAESRPLYWYFHRPKGGPMPALNVDNPRYRLAIAAWRRLPLWVVRRVGPRLARSIP
jgi:FemAB-related protein (PEP-CTERM system-associated)